MNSTTSKSVCYAMMLCGIVSTVSAVTFSWDPSVSAGIQYGDGPWDTSSTLFTTDSGATNVAWSNGAGDNVLSFSSSVTGTAPASVTLTLASNIYLQQINKGGSYASNVIIEGAGRTITLTSSGSPLFANNSATKTLQINAVVAGTNLQKTNQGTVILSQANTYTGTTTVTAGTLALSSGGSLVSSAYSIANGATFDVSAKTNYSLASVGTTISVGPTTSGFFNGPSGTLTLGNSLTLNFSTSSLTPGQTYNLFDFGSQTGDFSSVTLTGSIAGSLVLSSTDTWTGLLSGYNFTFSEASGVLAISAIPEPSTFAAIAGSIVLVGCIHSRRRAQRRSL